ncbi:hypothetical protein PV518_51260 [Streptomyces sp. ND04-05B]|uniref:hypothetical protein n=1 Tax=Streptomyces sp. ND04-05B TaxID=3028693 RepID=UPI0029A69FF3|nr:hypothetical protein [Streptomyces sp. ND04-05B]MDX3070404.1 hypothetical protein [Streptomyces sp. ND04-05B]
MTTAMRTASPRPERPQTDCALADRVAGMETPMLTEMAAATFHLERLLQSVGTPEQELAAYTVDMTAARHCDYVLGAADRIRRALDKLTAPYETPATTNTETGTDQSGAAA